MTNEVVDRFEKHVQAAGFLRLGAENKRLLAQFHEWLTHEPKAECAHVSTFPTNLCAECHKDLGWCYVCGKAPSKHAAEEYTACEAAL